MLFGGFLFMGSKKYLPWIAGCGIFIIIAIVFIILFCAVFAISSFKNKSKAELMNIVFIHPVISDPRIKFAKSGNEIAKIYLESWNMSQGESKAKYFSENSILIYDDHSSHEEVLTFYKDGRCSLSKKNCYMLYSEKKGEIVTPVLRTYYDNLGKTKQVKIKSSEKI